MNSPVSDAPAGWNGVRKRGLADPARPTAAPGIPESRRKNRAYERVVRFRLRLTARRERGFVLQQRGAVSRALGPLGWPRRCRWRPGWRRIYPFRWYRASAHPPLASGGRRPGSCRVRRAPGCRRARRPRPPALPAAANSSARRRARTSGAAVTKIFTSACGQMTVPMSRPSSTAPGGLAAKSRWKASSAARTCGIAETIEAASPDRGRLERRLVEARRIECQRRRQCGVFVVRPLAGVEHGLADGTIQQAGVEMAQAVMGGKLLAERALAGRGRPVDGDDHVKSTIACPPSFRGASAASEPGIRNHSQSLHLDSGSAPSARPE